MKTVPLVLSLVAAASAQYYNETSAPFHLVVTSDDGSINDTLSACHTGAALESLCLSNGKSTSKPDASDPTLFNFNTSIYSQPPAPGFGTPGILTWFLPSDPPIPSSVFFSYDPTTNIAVPILGPGSDTAQTLAFDTDNELVLQGYVDWSANPPNGTDSWKEYSRWYSCVTYYIGYEYENLAWGLGPGKPEDPTCVAVSVKRVFA